MTPQPAPDAAGILQKHGLRPRHSLGQNFLNDPVALQDVVHAAGISGGDSVLEIGAGVGTLTRLLAREAHRVIGVEVDAALATICRRELRDLANVEIVHGDILAISPAALGMPPGYVVAANIPYYITSPILRHLLESEPRPRRIVLTVQKEVAFRICAKPPQMNLLAISVQVHGVAGVVRDIPASAFHPRPRVDSAIIRIECFVQPLIPSSDLDKFFQSVKAGFLQPRKMLRNSMASALHVSAAEVDVRLGRVGIDSRRRAETLTIEDWARIADSSATTAG